MGVGLDSMSPMGLIEQAILNGGSSHGPFWASECGTLLFLGWCGSHFILFFTSPRSGMLAQLPPLTLDYSLPHKGLLVVSATAIHVSIGTIVAGAQ